MSESGGKGADEISVRIGHPGMPKIRFDGLATEWTYERTDDGITLTWKPVAPKPSPERP